jgi:hypothetical protein
MKDLETRELAQAAARTEAAGHHVGQAWLLNEAGTGLNIVVGLSYYRRLREGWNQRESRQGVADDNKTLDSNLLKRTKEREDIRMKNQTKGVSVR